MMMDDLIAMLKHIRTNTSWGKSQDLYSAAYYIKGEISELVEAIKREDKEGTLEEAADHLMMLLFCTIIIEDKYKCDLPEITRRACLKLKARYPSLFKDEDRQLMLFPNNVISNEDIVKETKKWNEQKKKYSKIEFCFCPNPDCAMYARPGSTNLTLIQKGNKDHIKCELCKNIYPLSKAILFYNCKKSKHDVLYAIATLAKGYSIEHASNLSGLSKEIIKNRNKTNGVYRKVLIHLLGERYGVDKF